MPDSLLIQSPSVPPPSDLSLDHAIPLADFPIEQWPISQEPMLRPPKNGAHTDFAYIILPWEPVRSRIACIQRGEGGSYHPLQGIFRHQGTWGMKKLRRIVRRINARWNVSSHAAAALKADWLMQFRNEPVHPWEHAEYQTGRRVAGRGAGDDAMLEPAPSGYLMVKAKMNGWPMNASPRMDSLRFWRIVAFHDVEWVREAGREDGPIHPRERQAARVGLTAHEMLEAGKEFSRCSRKAERLAEKCGDQREAERIRAIPYAERLAAALELRRQRVPLLLRHLHAIAVYRSNFECE